MDRDFLSRLKAGEEEAFRRLVETYQDKVIGTCFRFLHNREDAEDTAQDVFVEVHRSLAAFREEADLATWIYRIAVTKSLDVLRKRQRKKRLDAARRMLRLTPGPAEPPAPAADDPALALEMQERSRILREAIDGLAENQRAAFTLSRYEGLGNKSIADILGTSVPAVDSLIHRANISLRQRLERHYGKALKREE